ncbi:hypothetical protein Efla_006283 [Eimeria flavescens]
MEGSSLHASAGQASLPAEELLTPTQRAKASSPFLRAGSGAGASAAALVTSPLTGNEQKDSCAASSLSGLCFPLSAIVDFRDIPEGAAEETAELYPTLTPLLPATSMTRLRRSSAHSGASTSPFRLNSNCSPEDVEEANCASRGPCSLGACENFDVQQQQQQEEEQLDTSAMPLKAGPSPPPTSPGGLKASGSDQTSRSLPKDVGDSEFAAAKSPQDELESDAAITEQQWRSAARTPEHHITVAWQRHLRASWSGNGCLVASDLRLREETRRNTARNASPLSRKKMYPRQQLPSQQHRGSSSSIRPRAPAAAAAVAAFAAAASAPVTPLRPRPEAALPVGVEAARALGVAAVSSRGAAAAVAKAASTPPPSAAFAAGGNTQIVSPVRSILRAPSGPGSLRSASGRRVNFTQQHELSASAAAGRTRSPSLPRSPVALPLHDVRGHQAGTPLVTAASAVAAAATAAGSSPSLESGRRNPDSLKGQQRPVEVLSDSKALEVSPLHRSRCASEESRPAAASGSSGGRQEEHRRLSEQHQQQQEAGFEEPQAEAASSAVSATFELAHTPLGADPPATSADGETADFLDALTVTPESAPAEAATATTTEAAASADLPPANAAASMEAAAAAADTAVSAPAADPEAAPAEAITETGGTVTTGETYAAPAALAAAGAADAAPAAASEAAATPASTAASALSESGEAAAWSQATPTGAANATIQSTPAESPAAAARAEEGGELAMSDSQEASAIEGYGADSQQECTEPTAPNEAAAAESVADVVGPSTEGAERKRPATTAPAGTAGVTELGSACLSASPVGAAVDSSMSGVSTRCVVVSGEGEAEVLLQPSDCFVAAALTEPLRADPTPLRKTPSRPPPRDEVHAAAEVHWRPSRAAATAATEELPRAAAAPVAAETPEMMRDEEMEGHRGSTAAAKHLHLQKQQQHGVQGPDSLRSPAMGREALLASAAAPGQQISSFGAMSVVAAATAVAAGGPAAPAAVAWKVNSMVSRQETTHRLYSTFESQLEQLEQLQQQEEGEEDEEGEEQQQPEVEEDGGLGSRGHGRSSRESSDSSGTPSSPVTPFAGPDPLSGDVPLSPRLTVASGKGEAHVVFTSAASFLLSVRQQLEAQAARDHQQQQQQEEELAGGHENRKQQEDGATQVVQQQVIPRGSGETKAEAMEEAPGEGQQQQQQQQQQQSENPVEYQQHTEISSAALGGVQRRQSLLHAEQHGERRGEAPANAEAAAVESEGVEEGAAVAGMRSARSSNGAAARSVPAPFSAVHAEGMKLPSARGSITECSSNSRSSSSRTSVSGSSASKEAAAAEGGGSSSATAKPQWRRQWRALDALTSKLLQGLPRALTLIAEEDDGAPQAAAPTALAAASAVPAENRTRGDTAPSSVASAADTRPSAPQLSWVDYREERLREQQLLEGDKQKDARTLHDQDADNSSLPDGGGDEVEVQQLLERRLQQRAAAAAATTGERLLLHSAKTRGEWAKTCARAQAELQQQLHQELQPLSAQMAEDLQQLEQALQAAACRVEKTVEAKRRRLAQEPWEAGFVALAEERHVALQAAASSVAEKIEAAEAEIRGFADTSGDLRLLADIRHKESIVAAFQRLSGMRIQRVSTTGLVAELAWPRSFPASAALHLRGAATAAHTAAPSFNEPGLPQRLSAAGDSHVPSTKITISWSVEETQQQQQQKQPHQQLLQPTLEEASTQGFQKAQRQAAAAATAAAADAAAQPRTPVRQRIQILRPCLPPGGLMSDSAVCTPLLARGRGAALTAGGLASASAAGAAFATAAPLQQQQQQGEAAPASGSRFLPITSCKLQSRFPVLRAAVAAAAPASPSADALPPHKRWLYSVEMLRYLLLGAVQRTLQQMLSRVSRTRSRRRFLRRSTDCSSWQLLQCCVLLLQQDWGGASRSHTAAQGFPPPCATDRLRRSTTDMTSVSSACSGSSNTAAAAAATAASESRQREAGRPYFPDLSLVRALLLHAHAAAGRASLLHDQLLLLLRSFRSVTSVDFPEKAGSASLPALSFKTALAPCDEELPVLQLHLLVDLNEALERGSLLLAVDDVRVSCLSGADDLCSDGQAACAALRRAVENRLEALWDTEKQQLSKDGVHRVFCDEGLVELLYTACDECGYTRSVEDWGQRLSGEGSSSQDEERFPANSWGVAQAAALERWVTMLEGSGIVPPRQRRAPLNTVEGP